MTISRNKRKYLNQNLKRTPACLYYDCDKHFVLNNAIIFVFSLCLDVMITVYLCICIFSFVKAKCGKLLQERLVHLSSRTIKGSSYRDPWGVPYLDGDYSWCSKGVDIKREIELELSKRRIVLNLGHLVKGLAITKFLWHHLYVLFYLQNL